MVHVQAATACFQAADVEMHFGFLRQVWMQWLDSCHSKLEGESRQTAASGQLYKKRDPLTLVWVVALHTNNGLFPGRRFWSAGWILVSMSLLLLFMRMRETPMASIIPCFHLFFFISFFLVILQATAPLCIVYFFFSFLFWYQHIIEDNRADCFGM